MLQRPASPRQTRLRRATHCARSGRRRRRKWCDRPRRTIAVAA